MFNKIFAIVIILVLSPVFIIVSLLIFFSDGFPIFFKQNRVGYKGEIFKVYKFRSMIKNAEKILKEDPVLYNEYINNGYKIDAKKDPRILPFGLFLRSSSIDELPQFFNIIKNNMNIIGPRPVVEKELDTLYGNQKDIYLSMKPGITGLWQVSGRSNIKNSDRVKLNVEYFEKRSMYLNFKIILKTIIEIFKRTGAY